MNINVYRRILEKITNPYIIIKECELNKFKILEINHYFLDLLKDEKEKIVDKDIEYIFKDDKSVYEWIKLCNKEGIYKTKSYIKSLKWWYQIKIDNLEDGLYIIWLESFFEVNEASKFLLDKTIDIVWVKDIDLKYVHVSDKGLKITGFQLGDIIGKTDLEVFDEQTAKIFLKHDKELLECKKDSNKIEVKLLNKIYESNIYSIKDNEGNIIGILGYAIDKTEEIELKNSLKQQKQTMEILIDAIPDYIFYKDLDSNLIYCNKSYADKLVELPKSQIIGKKDIDLTVVDKDASLYRERDLEVINSNSMKVYYEDVTLKNNSVINLETIKVPYYNHDDEVIGVIGIARDITDRLKYQNELENIRMDFFTNLSHELRTPLNIIFSAVQVMKLKLNNLREEDYEFCKRYIDMTHQNGLRLLKLVNNLIDSNKISSGYMELESTNNDIVSFIENICFSVSEFIKQKNMNIIFDTDTEYQVVCFDLDKIERIMLNLLSNAIKFNKEKEDIEVNITNDSEWICISIKDNGIGIPEEKLPYIFDRFKQVKNNHAKVCQGSGIGLSLVKSLVDMHNGEIEVNSIEKKGTEFIVKIPNKVNDNVMKENKEKTDDLRVDTIKVEFSDIYNID